MIKIDEILKRNGMKENSLIFAFEDKKHKGKIDEHDKKHIRILAVLQIARDEKILTDVLAHKFKEEFKYDEENNMAIYKIIFIKERRKKPYANA